jgi:putative ABC transport system permease protein
MYIFKNALVSIKRNWGRNMLIGIIVMVIAAACTVTLAIRKSASDLVDAYESKYNVEATLSVNRDSLMSNMQGGTDSMEDNINKWNSITSPTLDEIKSYGDSDYVTSYYYTYQVGMNGKSITAATDSISKTSTDTSTTKYSGGMKGPGDEQQGGSSTTTTTHTEKIETNSLNGDFTVVGYSSYDGMSDFVSGNYTISDGEISEDFDSNNCVISSELAELNSLSVGDTITLVNPNNSKKTYTLTITGIYTDNTSDSSTMDKMFSNSANKIITSSNVVENMVNDDSSLKTTITPTYILRSKYVTDDFSTEVSNKGLSEYYQVTNNVDSISSETESISNVSSFATTFLIVTLIIGAVVLLIINMINVRERKYEIGVLRTIGMSKFAVISQFVFELLVVSFVGLLLGAAIGSATSVNVANNLLAKEITTSEEQTSKVSSNFGHGPDSSTETTENNGAPSMNGKVNGVANVKQVNSINAVVDISVLGELLGIGLLLTLISSASAMISIANFRPLTILKERS